MECLGACEPAQTHRDEPLGASSDPFKRPVQLEQQTFGRRPVDARIGDRHPIFELAQILWNRLAARLEVAFEHEADNGAIAVDNLRDAILGHQGLQVRILV